MVDRLRQVQRRERLPVVYVTHSPAEAIASGDRLLLLESGEIVGEGPPLEVLASREGASGRLVGVRNVFRGILADHEGGSSRVSIVDGPDLIVPRIDRPSGSPVVVSVRADDILLALGEVSGLSARNIVSGVVDRLVPHGGEAEVVVNSGQVRWIVSVVAEAVSALALQPGVPVRMIIKARSCRIAPQADPGLS